MDPAPVTIVVNRGGRQMTFHSEHRAMETYSRALEAAGMPIEAIREVGSTDELVARDPAEHRWMRVPLFLHMRAVR